jgi:hypothetical protein
MSNNRSVDSGSGRSRRTGAFGLALAAVALLVQLMPAPALGDTKMKTVEPRALVRAVTSKYVIYQGGTEVGSEIVTRSDFNDNSIQYQSKITMQFPQLSNMVIDTDLLLEEESRFPISYDMVKHVEQGQVGYDILINFEWFSNVAVIRKEVRAVPDTTHVVFPTGTAILDINAVHHLYVPLFWYDEEVGGHQNFNVVEPVTGKLYSANLRRLVNEKIAIGDDEISADRYEITRDKQSYTFFVDEDGRIVKVDQGFMLYELVEHVETSTGEE